MTTDGYLSHTSGAVPALKLQGVAPNPLGFDGIRNWSFDGGSYGAVSCRGNIHPGKTLVVMFEDEDFRLGDSTILHRGVVIKGETSAAPVLLFEELDESSGRPLGTHDAQSLFEAVHEVITQTLHLTGAEKVLFLGVGKGDYAALQVGRRFVDSMVLLLCPTDRAFTLNVGELSASQSGPRTTFEFYVERLSTAGGISPHYLDFKRSVGVRSGTGGSEDGRLRFELSDPGVWGNATTMHEEVQFWIEAAALHWQSELGSSDSVQHKHEGVPSQYFAEVEALSAKIAAAQKQLETILVEHRSSAREIRVLAKEFRAEARLAHLSSARSVTETVSLLRLASLLFPPEAELPPTGSFAVRPGTLAALVTTLLRSKPRVIVECGSGSSTVWFAAALRFLGGGHVYALEHEPNYGAQTQYYLDKNDVSSFATIVHAPLQEIETDGRSWYSRSAVRGLPHRIDVLFVDGPPKAVGEHVRAPAMAEFASRLFPGSLVLVDDMQRPDEQEIVAGWLADQTLPQLEFVIGLAELHVYRVVDRHDENALKDSLHDVV